MEKQRVWDDTLPPNRDAPRDVAIKGGLGVALRLRPPPPLALSRPRSPVRCNRRADRLPRRAVTHSGRPRSSRATPSSARSPMLCNGSPAARFASAAPSPRGGKVLLRRSTLPAGTIPTSHRPRTLPTAQISLDASMAGCKPCVLLFCPDATDGRGREAELLYITGRCNFPSAFESCPSAQGGRQRCGGALSGFEGGGRLSRGGQKAAHSIVAFAAGEGPH